MIRDDVDTLAPVRPVDVVEVRPEDVTVDADLRVVFLVRRRAGDRCYAAPAGVSAVVARRILEARSSAAEEDPGRSATPPAPLSRAPRDQFMLFIGMMLGFAVCICGWMLAVAIQGRVRP